MLLMRTLSPVAWMKSMKSMDRNLRALDEDTVTSRLDEGTADSGPNSP